MKNASFKYCYLHGYREDETCPIFAAGFDTWYGLSAMKEFGIAEFLNIYFSYFLLIIFTKK